jgi:inner membrane protein
VDPLTQGALGAAFAQTGARPEKLRDASVLGALSGMAPDLDVLISSRADPLLFLEFHRHFTHSLAFIPIGALICAGVFYYFVRRRLEFYQVYLFCLLGYASHGLLDAFTTYGTQLLWPFSNLRVAWNLISVVDPLFSVPLGLLVATTFIRRQRR